MNKNFEESSVESSTEVNQNPSTNSKPWSGVHVLTMATVCLGLGITVGYLARGPQNTAATTPAAPVATQQAMPSMDQMKQMADKTVEPLLAKLQAKPNDPGVLAQIAKSYFNTHQFPQAIAYAERAVQADPKQVGNRADLAAYLFYSGDADKAIATLEDALSVEPTNPQVLYNLASLKLKAKNDNAGAIVLWKRLLKTNPDLPQARKIVVERAIAAAAANPAPEVK